LPHADTVLYVDSLIPNHSYRLVTEQILSFGSIDSSESFVFTTLDTTSNNFTWQIDTLGDGANSTLKDVSIVNDSCIFAVGEIHIKDSTGNWDPNLYSVAKWNGAKWIYSVGAPVIINAVYAFSANDVWAGTTAPYHFNGIEWQGYNVTGLFNGYITKIWGTSSSNVYVVGTNGAIMHFDGTTWKQMESGTNVDLLDVWGSPDGSVVWACGFKDCCPGTYLLRNTGTGWQIAYDGTASQFTIKKDSLSGTFTNVFAPSNQRLYVLTDAGLYTISKTTHGEANLIPMMYGFPRGLRGNGSNDLFAVGEYYMIVHFNGSTVHYFSELEGSGRIVAVSQKNNSVFAVGYSFDPINSRGIVFRGKR